MIIINYTKAKFTNMSLSDKPFVCDEKNCFMTFANEDHLNSHKKKHNMSFILELDPKNNEAVLGDQTPTPTSFFRNCEEVGLFQDLQNVNPFEETFKKAIENSDNTVLKLGTLSDVTNDDTLHTPHIFPSVEDPLHEDILDINNSELSIVNLIEIPQIGEKIESLIDISNHKVSEKSPSLRSILKEALMKKDKVRNNKNLENTITIRTLNSNPTNTTFQDNTKSKGIKSNDKSNIERIREINRAAQMKCRVKKKRQMDKMLNELKNLKKENLELRKENAQLKQSNMHLWKAVEDLGGSKDTLLDKIKSSLDKQDTDNPSEMSPKQLPLLAPAGTISSPKIAPPAPIIFSLVPVQIFNTNTITGPPPLIKSDMKRQKIIPRILRKT
ncbi:uncharacterized protein LOC123677139 isoform X2 [Harmonia axyridis]|uniref:uncharacterized protein LOC123677139 isoform X2 n=1 Tax=Harmonia axyridis TaxID=115357 RepID=UPI001E276219|nr:uncharacterized protein LOC123677139 isoform X2 [Harmonia axyridis]